MKNHYVLTAQESSSLSLSMQGRGELEEEEEVELFWVEILLSPPILLSSLALVLFSFLFFPLSVQKQNSYE